MYSEFPNSILVLDTTLEGMFWTPFSCRYKVTCSLPPPTSLSAACITWCWEMRPGCKAEMNHPWPAKSAGPSLPTPWNAAGPRGYGNTLLHSQCWSLSLATLALAVAQLRKFKPPGKNRRKMHHGRSMWVVNMLSLLLIFFFPSYLGETNVEMIKYCPTVFSKPSSETRKRHCFTPSTPHHTLTQF